MGLPTPEILKDIDKLITEITGFQENDENFFVWQQYCLSQVMHHTYPCVNKTDVRTLIESYISRFYGHGYFKISQELNHQVEKFLSNDKLFEKNLQYDIQWCLLNLVCLLSANLTSVKRLPQLLPTDCQENELDNINWNEYLVKDLKLQFCKISSDSEAESIKDEEDNCCAEVPALSQEEMNDDQINKAKENENTIRHGDLICKKALELRKETIKKIMNQKNFTMNLEYDFKLRGNISEKFDRLMIAEGIYRKSQYLSEYQLMEYILHQFLTGERIFIKKGLNNPALISITQDTLSNYLTSLQLYFKITRSFMDFDSEITEAKFLEKFQGKNHRPLEVPQGSSLMFKKQKIPNVLYIYSIMLKKALESFQSDLLSIADNLQSYTLIRMERKLQPHFRGLTSLFRVHCLATQNWKKTSNWICSIRILSVLYHAIMDAVTEYESFLFMNLFLHCFKVYLDIVDSWVSSLDLNDPYEEFIIQKSTTFMTSEEFGSEFEVRPYLEEMNKEGIKKVPILDFIAEEMIHVGESLVVLKRLGRYVNDDSISRPSLFQKLIKNLNKEVNSLRELKPFSPMPKNKEKKKSIFTLSNIKLNLKRDDGCGDFLDNENEKELKVSRENICEVLNSKESRESNEDCINFIISTIKNPYFKMALNTMRIDSTFKKLEEAKNRNGDNLAFMLVNKTNDKICSFYSIHKLITETCQYILNRRVFNACVLVKNIVLTEFDLHAHFSLLKSVFFIESYLIQSFIINLFTQPFILKNSYSLTLHLRECLESRYTNLASAVSVSVEKNYLIDNSNILNAIDAIIIKYEIKWPLTLIFTSDAMIKYNKVFRFALKLKWARWVLCNLHFELTAKNINPFIDGKINNSTPVKSNTLHRLQLLKFRILSTLSTIENYFISHLTSCDLDLNSYKDLRDIIYCHSNFIEKICRNCLLNERTPKVGILILQILIPLCMDMEKIILQNCAIADSLLSLMETRFDNCHFQLSRLLLSAETE